MLIKTRILKRVQLGTTQNGNVCSLAIEHGPGDRLAECTQCSKESFSQPDLPFFRLKIDKPKDEYYCGCKGWD